MAVQRRLSSEGRLSNGAKAWRISAQGSDKGGSVDVPSLIVTIVLGVIACGRPSKQEEQARISRETAPAMALSPGTRLGPYEIVGALGAGGMGEVYRARDTRLDRTVAVKVLPSEVAADPERRARFEREAKAVAALDHPHICGIHDVGEADGTHFLVMPLVEGQTLAARLERGPLPLDQALKVAAEVADALDKAHRQGIVHRDLKPANIMLTKTGARLLDFGLAKLRPAAGPISLSGMTGVAPPPPGTAQGVVLGTMPYMAPEQVEGRDADARSDIWALGAVLYEMVTGTRPFQGETPASVIGSILKDTPAPVSVRQPLAPPSLDYVVDRCLAKDADERWQSVADVGRVLDWTRVQQVGYPHGRWRERAAWIAATAVPLSALAYVLTWPTQVVSTGELVRLSVYPPEGMAFAAHTVATVPTPQFALSPDGRSIAFVAEAPARRPAIWVRSWDEVDARVLPGTDDASEPFWSPDSLWVGFFDGQSRLKKVPASGGPVQTIADGATDPRGGSWGPDDTILFGTGYSGVYRVAAMGGVPQPVTDLDLSRQEGSHRWPQFLPDGRHFLFTVRSGMSSQRGVYVSALDDKTRRLLIRSDGNARYAPPGYLLSLDEDTLLAQSFDHERLELEGEAVPIAPRVGRNSRGDGAFSSSHAGTLAYAGASLRLGRLTWFDRSGTRLAVVGPDGEHDYADFRLSPDETRVAASLVSPTLGVPDIWLFDLVRGGEQQFTFGPGVNAAPVWSPDGGRIVFRTNRKGVLELFQKSAGAGGSDEPLLPEDILRTMEARAREVGASTSNLTVSDWSRDGQYVAVATGLPADLWLLPTADPAKLSVVVRSPANQMHANFSPDVRFIAYSSNESGRYEVYAEPLPTSDLKIPISTNGGYEPRWRADGKEIYYLSEDRRLMAVAVTSAGGATPFGVPRPLFQTDVHPGVNMLRTHYVPSLDGTRFLVDTRSHETTNVPITVVLNWIAALQR
jgi:eukaryotic-like serine/threonine-protein kinase